MNNFFWCIGLPIFFIIFCIAALIEENIHSNEKIELAKIAMMQKGKEK